MAEGVFERLVEQDGRLSDFEIDSAGILGYHQGEPADTRMRQHASKRGYNLTHRSRPVTKEDFAYFDYIIGMDEQNIRDLRRIAETSENIGKIYQMTDFCQRMSDDKVPDPYYGGDSGFEYVIDLLEDSCRGLYDFVCK